jgi:hypothetical protein
VRHEAEMWAGRLCLSSSAGLKRSGTTRHEAAHDFFAGATTGATTGSSLMKGDSDCWRSLVDRYRIHPSIGAVEPCLLSPPGGCRGSSPCFLPCAQPAGQNALTPAAAQRFVERDEIGEAVGAGGNQGALGGVEILLGEEHVRVAVNALAVAQVGEFVAALLGGD